jgi:alkyl hydroperoxide reductase subunit AhpC
MALHLGEIAPDFTQDSTAGTIRFHEWIGTSWCILFSHPKDFTPVCTTELGTVAKLQGEFQKRNCKVVALSVDSVADHKRWVGDIQETQGKSIDYPILGDPDRKVATLYDMIHPKANDTFTVRSVFIIDPNKKIRLILTYPASAGRNFTELLRVLDSMQLTDKFKVATPADWKDGQDVIIAPAVTNDEAKKLFPKGFKELKPYLRFTPQPNR